jgi:hypothetical protein
VPKEWEGQHYVSGLERHAVVKLLEDWTSTSWPSSQLCINHISPLRYYCVV